MSPAQFLLSPAQFWLRVFLYLIVLHFVLEQIAIGLYVLSGSRELFLLVGLIDLCAFLLALGSWIPIFSPPKDKVFLKAYKKIFFCK